jgi:hypothetical protein
MEFFKLDEIDQRVLLWLMDYKSVKTIKGWIEYVAADYKKRRIADINPTKLYEEVMNGFEE